MNSALNELSVRDATCRLVMHLSVRDATYRLEMHLSVRDALVG